jgi:DNA-binding NarL/FixJ family response regulator
VVVMDIAMPGVNGLSATRKSAIQTRFWLLLSMITKEYVLL